MRKKDTKEILIEIAISVVFVMSTFMIIILIAHEVSI